MIHAAELVPPCISNPQPRHGAAVAPKRQKIAVMLHLPSIKAFLVGTPFEAAALRLRWLLNFPRRYRHPELWGIYLEEEHLPQVLRKLLKPDSSALDVGAHIGSFTSLLLQIAPKGRHVAIEASPSKAAWLRKRFHNVDVHSIAASDTNGTATFQEDTQLSGFSRLSAEAANDHSISYTVETCRLDSLLSGGDLDPDQDRCRGIRVVRFARRDGNHQKMPSRYYFRMRRRIYSCKTRDKPTRTFRFSDSRSQLFHFHVCRLSFRQGRYGV